MRLALMLSSGTSKNGLARSRWYRSWRYTERWHQALLDVGQQTGAVDRPIKHGWRGEACHAQRPEKRRGVPAAIRRVVWDPGAGQPAAIAANQIGPHTTLIEKHEARGIERRRRGAPGRAGEADVSAIVFRRVYRFF